MWWTSLEGVGAATNEVAAVAKAAAGLSSPFPSPRAYAWRRPPHPLLQRSVAVGELGVQHVVRFHATLMELFSEHTIAGRNLFPGAGFLEMALAVVAQEAKASASAVVSLEDVAFISPFDLRQGAVLVCERVFGAGLEMRPGSNSSGGSRGRGRKEAPCCVVGHAACSSERQGVVASSLSALQKECTEAVTGVAERYAQLEALGFHQGAFQSLLEVWRNPSKDVLLARLRVIRAGGAVRVLGTKRVRTRRGRRPR